MALQPIIKPWPPIIYTSNSSILHGQLPVATPEKCGSIFFYTFLPFKPRSPYCSITSELSFQGFFEYAIKRESLSMSSPL
jgi:hypothetical protein